VDPTTIEILFVPAGTTFIFRRFTEREDIVDFGPVSPDAQVRCTKRNSASYSAWEVQAIPSGWRLRQRAGTTPRSDTMVSTRSRTEGWGLVKPRVSSTHSTKTALR
jgi:hypothetical protein